MVVWSSVIVNKRERERERERERRERERVCVYNCARVFGRKYVIGTR